MILNKDEGIMLIQVRKCQDVILFQYNIKSSNIEGSITFFKNVSCKKYGQLSKGFFDNHLDFDGGINVAVSPIMKQIKDFTKCGKKDYKLLLCQPLNMNNVKYWKYYGAYCVGNRNNQILFAIIQNNPSTLYELLDLCNN